MDGPTGPYLDGVPCHKKEKKKKKEVSMHNFFLGSLLLLLLLFFAWLADISMILHCGEFIFNTDGIC